MSPFARRRSLFHPPARHLAGAWASVAIGLGAAAAQAQTPAPAQTPVQAQTPMQAQPPAIPQAQPTTEAAALPTDPTLAALLAASLETRPELLRAQAASRAGVERIDQADALPDPTLQLGLQNDGFTSIEVGRAEASYVSLMASQTFPWPGKRALQRQVAEVAATQAREAETRVRLFTEAEVRRSYLDLLLVRDRLALLDQLAALWDNAAAAARINYERGAGVQSDLLRAQLEQSRLQQRRIVLRAEETGRLQALNRWRAQPLDTPIDTSGTSVGRLPPLAGFEAFFSEARALARSPELAAARLAVTEADASVSLSERGPYPDLTVGAGLMYRGALPPMWLVTLGAPVPLFADRKQDRAIAENQAWSTAARQDVIALEQTLALATAERRAAFAALRETLALYDQGLLVQSRVTAESTLSQFSVGKVGFIAVLEANAGYLADQEAWLMSLAEAHRLLIAEAEVNPSAPGIASAGAGGSASMPGNRSTGGPTAGAARTSGDGPAPAASGGSMSSM